MAYIDIRCGENERGEQLSGCAHENPISDMRKFSNNVQTSSFLCENYQHR